MQKANSPLVMIRSCNSNSNKNSKKRNNCRTIISITNVIRNMVTVTMVMDVIILPSDEPSLDCDDFEDNDVSEDGS